MSNKDESKVSGLRIVFFGTPDFAVASLKALIEAGFSVVAVVTAPDKPAGRGMQLQQSAVKKFATLHGIPVLQPVKLKNPEFLEELRSYKADLQVVVAFRMLPEEVWNMPPLGTINVHASLLPQYRGAAPINWAIINGETQTGVTTFRLKHEIDTGDMLLQDTLAIGPHETAGELHDRMKEAGANLLVKTLHALQNNTLIATPQPQEGIILKHAPKIFTETCRIEPTKTCLEVHNLIRGLSPFPGAFYWIDGKMLKIFRSIPATDKPANTAPGSFFTDGKTRLSLACADGWLDLLELQLEGKKRMSTADFLRGYRLKSAG
jgi:methionyl-tRNA formyltransferase